MIYNPLEDYQDKYKPAHSQKVTAFFDQLVAKSRVDIEENRRTVNEIAKYREQLKQLKRKRNWLRFLRVLLCITILLIPLVIMKLTPKIRELKSAIDEAENRAEDLQQQANNQMLPLNKLFDAWDSIKLIEEVMPLISFEDKLTIEQEQNMKQNFDFRDPQENEKSTLDTLAGNFNGNPFLFEKRLVHEMGVETYHGYKTISWTETYRDSNGKLQTRTRTQTLHATVTKPKPFYQEQVVLHYGAQGGPELCFSRDASHLEQKSEQQIERIVKRGEKKLQRLNEKAIRENDDFMSMANSDFEVLFDALDRTDEVQYRTLFTPLAQTNMVDLILSKIGYGDDFHFIKRKRMNTILTKHSQGRALLLPTSSYTSYSYDIIRSNFISKNEEFFKAIYFDLAPVLAIPMYQERPVHSLDPIPETPQLFSLRECEALANRVNHSHMVHPDTKTQYILKTSYLKSAGGADETKVTAYSYDKEARVDIVSVYGGDGRYHNVSVPWDEYLPLTAENDFFVSYLDIGKNSSVLADRNGLCIYN